jgi:aspartate/methionine/tyrosine aminotransferase
MPDGAFYAWADARPLLGRLGVPDSAALVERLMREAHVVATPSVDFSAHDAGTHVRFSTASAMEDLDEALQRLARWLG